MTTATLATPVVETVQKAFNFSVDKFPLSGPDNMSTPFYGLFCSHNHAVVGNAVSKIYVPHQTDDVLALVESAATAFDGIAEVKCHFREGHYVTVEPSKDYRRMIFGSADNIFPRVIIRAGYDGRAFSASVGYWRDLCKNMHRMMTVRGTTVSIRHTSGLRSKMDELIQTFSVLKDSWATLADVIARLEDARVEMPAFLDAVYGQPVDGETSRARTIHENRTKAIFKRLSNERFIMGKPAMSGKFEVSAWEAFNAIQGYTQHETPRRKIYSGPFDRMLATWSDRDVNKAEQLVYDMVA